MSRTDSLRLLSGVAALAMILFVAPTSAVAGGGCHSDAQQPDAATPETATVTLEGCAFGPAILHVTADTEVTFVNRDPVPHAVTGAGWGDVTAIDMGDSVSHRFGQPGIYPYQCYLHPGMVGAIVVEGETLGVTPAEPSAGASPASDA